MTEWQTWWGQKLAERCLGNLRKHGFEAHFAADLESARQLIFGLIQGFETFGFGGSETTRRLGLIEILQKQGKIVYDHWQKDLTAEQDLALRLSQGRCDCFLCSANAISATGEIVNVDGIGNRTNAMSFGTRKVVIIAGLNKVTQTLEAALARIREIAAPMRAKSLGMSTPCAETGVCSDCNSPQRICRITTILHRRPMLSDVSVVLINQPLGF
jgi:hypothetical protein